MHLDLGLARHNKRQTILPSVDGLGGAITAAATQTTPTDTALILTSNTLAGTPAEAPPLATDLTVTISVTSTTATSSSSASAAATSAASAMKSSSSVAVSTVIAACVGAFAGMALLICIFIWWSRHPSTKKARDLPRSPVAEHRNARGREEQERTRSGLWDRLDEDKWAGRAPSPQMTRQMSQQEADEKNFSMFKKRSPSMRTTRTAKALEEHGFNMPPVELSKYHPGLAQELALEQPELPYAARQESGVSWDGETLGDDSFLSLRSVRIESGAMSPTMAMVKMTPPAMPSQLHRWESAEVLTIDESPVAGPSSEGGNPFSDANEERRKSRSNPFFNAGEVHRGPSSRRSRSNSRGQSQTREPSRSRSIVRARVVSEVGSTIDPFADLADAPPAISLPDIALPYDAAHEHTMSLTSEEAEEVIATSDRAMQSLIAALDINEPEDARLHVQSMLSTRSVQPSPASRYSFESGEIGVARDYPPSPVSPQAH